MYLYGLSRYNELMDQNPPPNEENRPVFIISRNWPRFLAATIDGIFTLIPTFAMYVLIFLPGFVLFYQKNQTAFQIYVYLGFLTLLVFFFGFAFVYFIYWPAKHNGQTFGKKLMGIRVVTEMGEVPRLWTFVIRYTIQVALAQLVGVFQYIVIFFDPQRRAIHDMIVKTFVIELES